MYKEHCIAAIAPAMRDDLSVFRRGFMFAVCSIRQATINVPDQLGVLFDGAEGENPLFGHKFNAWAHISDDAKAAYLWKKLNFYYCLKDTFRDRPTRAATSVALETLLEVPGLGIVKSAFILQLMGFDVACLDSRNVKREKRNPREFRTDGLPATKLRAKVGAYLDETFGRAAEYWDAWCADVATSYSMTAEAVSALHLSILPANYIPF